MMKTFELREEFVQEVTPVSTDTLKVCDLLERTVSMLETAINCNGLRESRYSTVTWHEIESVTQGIRSNLPGPDETPDESMYYDLSELFELIDDITPAGYYYGTSPGDGACYGFFPAQLAI